MSQNLVGVVKAYKGKWYLWPEVFEEVVGDEENGNKRYLSIKDAFGPYNDQLEAMQKGEKEFNKKYREQGFEYGVGNYDKIDGIKLVVTD